VQPRFVVGDGAELSYCVPLHVIHAAHAEALSEPTGLNVLASQSTQVGFTPALPGVITCCPAPHAHTLLWEALPGSVSTMPEPQLVNGVQEAAPVLAAKPVVQVAQAAELLDPMAGLAVPMAHPVHALTFAASLYDPRLHGEHARLEVAVGCVVTYWPARQFVRSPHTLFVVLLPAVCKY
jgi:hypothetical protein